MNLYPALLYAGPIVLAAFLSGGLMAAEVEKTAVLVGDAGQVISIVDSEGGEVTLRIDGKPKTMLRWLPDGERLSYLVRSTAGAKADLVIVDLTGRILNQVPIRPVTVPRRDGLRFIERISWIDRDSVQIGGSVNPRNCEIFSLDTRSGQESNWQFGECWSFVTSPDGKHVAYRSPADWGPEEERRDGVEIDDEAVHYSGVPPMRGRTAESAAAKLRDGIRIIAGPVWSPDSRRIAIVERDAATDEAAVAVLSVAGAVDRIPLPNPADEIAADSLHWLKPDLVLSVRGKVLAVDLGRKRLRDADQEVLGRLAQMRRLTDGDGEALNRTSAVVKRLKGRQGASWPGGQIWPNN